MNVERGVYLLFSGFAPPSVMLCCQLSYALTSAIHQEDFFCMPDCVEASASVGDACAQGSQVHERVCVNVLLAGMSAAVDHSTLTMEEGRPTKGAAELEQVQVAHIRLLAVLKATSAQGCARRHQQEVQGAWYVLQLASRCNTLNKHVSIAALPWL